MNYKVWNNKMQEIANAVQAGHITGVEAQEQREMLYQQLAIKPSNRSTSK